MSEATKYEYRAISMGDGVWMVHRWEAGRQLHSWKEAQVTISALADGDAAIKAAIAQGSWA